MGDDRSHRLRDPRRRWRVHAYGFSLNIESVHAVRSIRIVSFSPGAPISQRCLSRSEQRDCVFLLSLECNTRRNWSYTEPPFTVEEGKQYNECNDATPSPVPSDSIPLILLVGI